MHRSWAELISLYELNYWTNNNFMSLKKLKLESCKTNNLYQIKKFIYGVWYLAINSRDKIEKNDGISKFKHDYSLNSIYISGILFRFHIINIFSNYIMPSHAMSLDVDLQLYLHVTSKQETYWGDCWKGCC